MSKAKIIDFDKAYKLSLRLYENNSYIKVFHVTKNKIDYDWSGVTEIILQIKPDKKSSTIILTLKVSTKDIVLTTGYMRLIIPTTKTGITPGTYENVEMLVVYSDGRKRTWCDGGECEVVRRGIADNG